MRWLLCALVIFYSTLSFAQVYSDSTIIKRFGNSIDSAVYDEYTHDDFIVKVKPEKIAAFQQKFYSQVHRRFNESWFLIHQNKYMLGKESLIEKYFRANFKWKLSPGLTGNLTLKVNTPYTFIIETDGSKATDSLLSTNYIIISRSNNVFVIRCTLSDVYYFISNEHIVSVQLRTRTPKEETVINDYDNSVNNINLFFEKFPAVTGSNLTASVKENLFDTTDIDFKNRYIITNNQSVSVTAHATTMATLIGGGGNSFYSGKGVARGVQMSSSDFANLLPDADTLFAKYHITVQNNSYGVGIENFYGSDAAAYDKSIRDNPFLLQIFSAGNAGQEAASDGQYAGIEGFANLTGSFKQAKNIITAGSVDSFYKVPGLSSKGPAYDGRIKPELVAYGNDGSSGAAAITSGTALAVQSAYASVHNDSLPANALVKAILINSADDILSEGPDYYSGYGNVNTYKAVRNALSNQFFKSTIKNKENKTFTVNIPLNTKQLKITLLWNDEPARALSSVALVNDVDIKVMNGGKIWLPWILNSNANALSVPAMHGRDSLNVQEQITINNPPAGQYDIQVSGYNVLTASQEFFLVYETEAADNFYFIRPVANESFQRNSLLTFRWQSTFATANGKLEYSLDSGTTWQTINDKFNLKKGYYQWLTPNVNSLALLKMTIDSKVYISDTFSISSQLYPKVGYYCADSALIYWNREKNISSYKIYRLGNQYIQPVNKTTDTSIIVNNNTSAYIAVAPVFSNGIEGVRSYTFNYTTQGTACYISNFLADITVDNKAQLHLTLGTTFNVAAVIFQVKTFSGWRTINTSEAINNTEVFYLYSQLNNGINTFRTAVKLNNGTIVTSSEATIFYLKKDLFTLFPNPLSRGKKLMLLSGNGLQNIVQIFDVTGRKVAEETTVGTLQAIDIARLAKGIYFVKIYNDNELLYYSKLAIQ